MTKKFNGVALPKRIIPVPNSISFEAQEALHKHVDPNGVPHGGFGDAP